MSAENRHLTLLWTSPDPETAENMVFMYAPNSMRRGWWDCVTLVIWGAPTRLVHEDPHMQALVREAVEAGVKVSACRACADRYGASEHLESMGIEVKFWGQPLTEILESDGRLLTI